MQCCDQNIKDGNGAGDILAYITYWKELTP